MIYGPAPAWCFPIFEYSMYLLFLFCFVHALRQGARDVLYLLGGLAFGLTLEYIEVISDMGYTYGRFAVMFGHAPKDIPLCIGVGWGIIMYSARLFSDTLGLSIWAAAALDTILAVNIDLSMDTVAYRMHMWTWNWSGTNLDPMRAQWFGVPYGNFYGWEVVVFCYSAFSRLFGRYLLPRLSGKVLRFILVAILALFCSELFLYGSELYIDPFLSKQLGISSFHRVVGSMTLFTIIVLWNWRKRTASRKPMPAMAWWVPGWFHLFFFAGLFLAGFYTENKWMTIASAINLLVGVALHIIPFRNRKTGYAY